MRRTPAQAALQELGKGPKPHRMAIVPVDEDDGDHPENFQRVSRKIVDHSYDFTALLLLQKEVGLVLVACCCEEISDKDVCSRVRRLTCGAWTGNRGRNLLTGLWVPRTRCGACAPL